ncbi:MAG TPA: orotidine-5'-phosphate decarboxylase [Capsulimonadaceae bacterium]|nr:orotidine-5'-phosphate decarboxylase [Capsulimonadaceae bacterium]
MQETNNPILVGLDVANVDQAGQLVTQLAGLVGGFKIGLELFNTAGPAVFDQVRAAAGGEARIFYDAKLHDIPNTVAGAIRAAAKHDLWMINIHASGGRDMMRAGVDAAKSAASPPLVIAVTVLTSLDDAVLQGQLGVARTAEEQVVALARLAQGAGCDGVVASPREIKAIKAVCGRDFLVVAPGVRPAGAELGDQKRVATPGQAVQDGADYIVVARPIVQDADPPSAARYILREIAGVR